MGWKDFFIGLAVLNMRINLFLKALLCLQFGKFPRRRTTLDIDFSTHYDNQIATIEKIIRDVCKVSVAPDGLVLICRR